MALTDAYAQGAPALRPEDVRRLRFPNINTCAALNDVEAANIILGQEWALRARTASSASILTDRYRPSLTSGLTTSSLSGGHGGARCEA